MPSSMSPGLESRIWPKRSWLNYNRPSLIFKCRFSCLRSAGVCVCVWQPETEEVKRVKHKHIIDLVRWVWVWFIWPDQTGTDFGQQTSYTSACALHILDFQNGPNLLASSMCLQSIERCKMVSSAVWEPIKNAIETQTITKIQINAQTMKTKTKKERKNSLNLIWPDWIVATMVLVAATGSLIILFGSQSNPPRTKCPHSWNTSLAFAMIQEK